MYNTKLNNYHLKPKPSNIQTPLVVSQFIFELLKSEIPTNSLILDPCSGQGSLLSPWKETGYPTWGIDIDPTSTADAITDFFTLKPYQSEWNLEANLILCNPPFNGYGNKLGSEVWLDKIIELFGKDIPIVLFTPMGFRLNSKKSGQRWNKFINQKYPLISSIVSLPRDIFPAVEFHSEILIFNIPNLQPHYFLSTN
jgi:hypothetical protein